MIKNLAAVLLNVVVATSCSALPHEQAETGSDAVASEAGAANVANEGVGPIVLTWPPPAPGVAVDVQLEGDSTREGEELIAVDYIAPDPSVADPPIEGILLPSDWCRYPQEDTGANIYIGLSEETAKAVAVERGDSLFVAARDSAWCSVPSWFHRSGHVYVTLEAGIVANAREDLLDFAEDD
ncbi:MAG: hypothetical protein R2733_10640 [Acidimicrobiales bacterium]